MKASKLIAAVVSGAAALALVGGIAYAIEPDRDPATLPMPEAAQGTSIAKQVASIIVYEDQEEAVAMASELLSPTEKSSTGTFMNRKAPISIFCTRCVPSSFPIPFSASGLWKRRSVSSCCFSSIKF